MKNRILVFFSFFLFIFHIPSIYSNPKKITVLGTGYVGLVSGACFADFGNQVICADIDKQKIEQLQSFYIPIYEPMLDEIVIRNAKKGNLSFTSDIDNAIQSSDIIFIAVGTPMNEQTGDADLRALKGAIEFIARNLIEYKVIVIKSTVPPGTCAWVEKFLAEECGIEPEKFSIVSCPEFLREGSAIYDFLNPDRIIIGSHSSEAFNQIYQIHLPLKEKNVPIINTTLGAAELIKYVTNSFLALKISFINEIANFCDAIGVDVKTIAYALGLDKRISPLFLNPGPGFGGSCFPKDVAALIKNAEKNNVDLQTLVAALKANEKQKEKPFEKLKKQFNNNISDKTIAILGLAFKANTDDIRYSPSIRLIELLKEHNVTIKAYDPEAMKNMQKIFPDIYYGTSVDDTIKNSDAIVVMTDWNEFKNLNWNYIKNEMHENSVIIDARNILDGQELKQLGFKYDAIGRAFLNSYKYKRAGCFLYNYAMCL
jgi:UDPglucose 6-dehydrogenase